MTTTKAFLLAGLCFIGALGSQAQGPSITRQPADQSASLGATVQFTVTATSTAPPIIYQWRFNDVPLDPALNPSGARSTLSLTNVTLASAGRYSVVVTDPNGSATSQVAILTVDLTFTKITSGPVVSDIGGWSQANWWDYDNDGWIDLYVGNASTSGNVNDATYHNDGNGSFSKVTNAISTRLASSWAGAVGDYNNDGYEDLFSVHVSGADDLYRNEGEGNLTRLTNFQAGPPVGDADNSVDAGWADYDRDGLIDLFTVNAYYAAANDCLYRNNGDGTFSKMTTNQVGMVVGDRAANGPCVWIDYDNDSWPDLWIGSAWGDNGASGKQSLYHNNRDGTFSQVSAGSLDLNLARGTALWADYDNDGYLDVFLSSWTRTNSLHRNLVGQAFTDVTEAAGIVRSSGDLFAAWGDYDNDGFLDLIVLSYDGERGSILYHNNADGTFKSVDVGSPLQDGDRRTGAAWADYDNDGFLDLLITCGDASPLKNLLYHNSGNGNRWLKVKLTGTASNRSGIGAKVRVQATIRGQQIRQLREISGNSGVTAGSSGLLAHFGLGDATNVDLVRIEWPSGAVQELSNVAPKQFLTIWEPPAIKAAVSENGACLLTIKAEPNRAWRIEGSVDLENWELLDEVTSTTTPFTYIDSGFTSKVCRFYRIAGE